MKGLGLKFEDPDSMSLEIPLDRGKASLGDQIDLETPLASSGVYQKAIQYFAN